MDAVAYCDKKYTQLFRRAVGNDVCFKFFWVRSFVADAFVRLSPLSSKPSCNVDCFSFAEFHTGMAPRRSKNLLSTYNYSG